MTKYSRLIKPRKSLVKGGWFKLRKINFKLSLGKKSIVFGAVGVVCLSLLVYLVQVNKMATIGFEIRALEDEIVALEEGNKKLELQVIELQSMTYLSNHISHLNLVEAQDIEYLSTSGSAFAQR